MKLKGKVAVITGAGSGIGRATARLFAREGARVVIAEINEASGAETARMIQAEGGEAFCVVTDVSSPASVAVLFQAIDDRGWPVDILVNNAGNTEGGLTPAVDMTDRQWDAIIAVHLSGTFYCMREAIKRMKDRKSGAIINLGSVAGLGGLPGAASYTAAKGGVIAMTKGVSKEVAPLGIRVNCIAPGWIETPILDSLPAEMRPAMPQMTPLGRIGQPEEIAAVALFLASPDSSFVVGQTISPNGGLYT
ncbi:MAG TPA: 3-oxoacyl-ACP reductase FabG [Blastocatellia bacterium]|jgi:NAD(P)-dependent dehydrogenase (short-subunit alcohol dehydrogenase family)